MHSSFSCSRLLRTTASPSSWQLLLKTTRLVLFAGIPLLPGFSPHSPVLAATLPANFVESQIASGLSNPTAMGFAPDGRLFVCQQGGQLRVIKNGILLATP